jgi:drug/metabolite transporter (DMT)-like permease
VPRGYLPSLLVLTAIWGSSYMFIKIAVEDIEPAAMVELRLLSALLVLAGFVAFRHGPRALAEVRAALSGGLVLGVINMALPFTLIAWGEKYVDSGIAAIANSTVPIFVTLLAIRFRPSERARGLRLAGVLVGLGGVAVLAGLDPQGGWWAVAGTMAIVVASLSYASANLFTQHRFEGTSPVVVATASTAVAAVVLLPFAFLQLPQRAPSWGAVGSTLVLGVLGTAVASIYLYRMIARYGSARTSLVAYLLPAAALAYGSVFLEERITANAIGGLALILGGVALASGAVRLRRRATAPA